MNKKAILYIRGRADEQTGKYKSWEVQEEQLSQYCKQNDIEIINIFRDDVSGNTFDRTGLNQLIAYAKNTRNSNVLVLVTTWDRISRTSPNAYKIIRKLEMLNLSIQSIHQPINIGAPENVLMMAFFLNSQSNFKRKTITQRP